MRLQSPSLTGNFLDYTPIIGNRSLALRHQQFKLGLYDWVSFHLNAYTYSCLFTIKEFTSSLNWCCNYVLFQTHLNLGYA